MNRCCFTLHVRPDKIAAYGERHAAVWPEMLAALRDAGWHEYTLHLRGDGLLVGVVTTDDLEAAQAAMRGTAVNQRWQAEMAPFFLDLPGVAPDEGFALLETVFDLDAQIGASGPPAPHPQESPS